MKLPSNEYNPYYQPYIDKVIIDSTFADALRDNGKRIFEFYKTIPEQKMDYAYAPEKWSVKDILLHTIDTERIFAYRALRIARQDKTELAGFEQDDYVVSGKASQRSIEQLLMEYKTVRDATIALFNSFNETELLALGTASGSAVSVRAIGQIIIGHENHHVQVIRERYL